MLREDSLKRLRKDSMRGLVRPDSLERPGRQLMPEIQDFKIDGFQDEITNNILPLNDLEDKIESMENQILNRDSRHTDLKKGFFSMIDGVLGAGQSSTTQIANNMSMIQNNLSNVSCISNQQYSQVYDGAYLQFQAPEGPLTCKQSTPQLQFNLKNKKEENEIVEISPGLNKQQKLFDQSMIHNQNAMNSTMNSSGYVNSFNIGAPGQLDASLCGLNVPIDMNQQNLINQSHSLSGDDFQIRKMQSYQDKIVSDQHSAGKGEMGENDIGAQSQQSKKRSRKAYTKRAKKIDESGLSTTQSDAKKAEKVSNPSLSVKFAPEVEEMEDEDESFDEDMTNFDINKLTNKKKQYLQDAIIDKNGAYTYLEDPIEYKKARKRLQNRESAVRSRHRKKTYQETLEKQIEDLEAHTRKVMIQNKMFQQKNAELSSENQVLKQQVSYFQETFANSSLVGATPQVTMPQTLLNKEDYIHKKDLEKFKFELIQKINRRFLDEDEKEKAKNKDIIQRHQQNDCNISEQDNEHSMLFEKGDALEQIAGDRTNAGTRRSRVNSGRISLCDESRSVTTQPEEIDLDKVFVLERDSASSRGKGYFFLAVMFGMMCGSSYLGADGEKIIPSTSAGPARSPKHFIPRDIKSHDLGDEQMESRFSNMNLVSSDVSDEFINDSELQEADNGKQRLQKTAHLMKNIQNMSSNQVMQSMQGPFSGMMKSLVSGKYTYLTYLMCSTACAFMWMTPNQHKIRLIKPVVRVNQRSNSKSVKVSNRPENDIEMEF